MSLPAFFASTGRARGVVGRYRAKAAAGNSNPLFTLMRMREHAEREKAPRAARPSLTFPNDETYRARGALPVLVLTRTLLLAGVLLLLARLLLSAALLLTRLLGRFLGLLTRVILLTRVSLVWIAHSGSPLFHPERSQRPSPNAGCRVPAVSSWVIRWRGIVGIVADGTANKLCACRRRAHCRWCRTGFPPSCTLERVA